MNYNTQRSRLVQSEYGRIVQQMVDYALTIEDKKERQYCAETIIKIMASFYPQFQTSPDFEHKLWDHLEAMADYKLDVDAPYELKQKGDHGSEPKRLSYPMKRIRYKHYGYLLESLIEHVDKLESDENREFLINSIVNYMRQALLTWNKDSLSSDKIAQDLSDYTDGRIVLSSEVVASLISSSVTQASSRKKIKSSTR